MKRVLLWTAGIVGLLFLLLRVAQPLQDFGSAGSGRPSERPGSTISERPSGTPVHAHGAFLLEVGKGDPDLTADVYLVNAAGGAHRLVARGVDGEASWSPDGTRVLSSALRPGSDFWSDVVSYPVRGGQPLDLTRTERAGLYGGARWSPDGTRVAYSASYVNVSNSDLLVVPATGGRSHYLEGIESFAWSPDSRRLAYTAADYERPGVAVIPASGQRGRERALGTGEADSVDEWAPGGRILFDKDCPGQEQGCNAVHPPGNPQIWEFPASTYLWTGKKNIEIGSVDNAQFLPDGTVAYLDGRRIGLLKPDNTLRMVGPLPERATSATWSTDGRYLAFASALTGHVYIARTDGSGARRLPLNIGHTRQITVFGWRPRPEDPGP